MKIRRHFRHLLLACLSVAALLLSQASIAFSAEVKIPELESLVTRYVKERVQAFHGVDASSKEEKITIKILGMPGAPYRFPDTAIIHLACDTSSWSSSWSDRSIIRVRMSDDTGRSRDVGIPVQVTVQKPVWVVRNIVNTHSPLRLRDLSLELRDVSANYGYTVGENVDLSQYVTRVNLMPGEWLDARKLEIPPDVRYNDDIHLVMLGPNGMELNVPGVALASGQIGQTIRVRQAQFQRKNYVGKIVGKNLVEVEL